MRYLTAGESHGQKLIGIIEGLPAGLPVSKAIIDDALARRQKGPGRGGRMRIEKDQVQILSGVRGGKTTGAPVALEILNHDWDNWQDVMDWSENADLLRHKVTAPRPGHADLTGALKYRTEVRNVLERASARETAMRVAIGSVAKQLLGALGICIKGHVLCIGGVTAVTDDSERYWQQVENSEWSVGDPEAETKLWQVLQQARSAGETLGGIVEVQIHNVLPGLGSHVQWDRKLDGRLAQAVLSVQGIKGIAFGMGFEAGKYLGSQVHDPIAYSPERGYFRTSNHAGGIEGGMSNGEPIVFRAVMKPIPTLLSPLDTVDMESKQRVKASVERSDICAVPAALVVLEHVAAWVLAEAVLEKFPADSFQELLESWKNYRKFLLLS